MKVFNQIQGCVTHYTEQIKLTGKHLEEVRIGGEIKSVVIPIDHENSKPNSLEGSYVLTIDDGIGEIFVYVSSLMFHHFSHILQEGNIVVFKGFVNVVSRTIAEQTKRDVSVVAFDAQSIEELKFNEEYSCLS